MAFGRGRRSPRANGRASARRLASAACLVLAGALLFALGGCALFPNARPVAAIDVSRNSGPVPLTILFDASASYDPDGSIRKYRWDCGDGEVVEGSPMEHTYTEAGTFTVILTVTDTMGGKAKASVTITVRASNESPVAAFAISPSPAQPLQLVWFDAGASYDPDGWLVSYAWDFGDGTTGSGSLASHNYQDLGTYDVTLTVVDNDGAERTNEMPLVIGDVIPADVTIPRHYAWEYYGTQQSVDLAIPADLYTYYKSQPRTGMHSRDYDAYVLDPLDDEYLEVVTAKILETTAGDYHASLENSLFFVQACIRYVYDPYWYEYPRYPVELLVDGGGDCEDTAILYTSLARTLGHGALMVVVDTNTDGTMDHMVAWVPVEQSFIDAHPDRSFWDYHGMTYAFAETAVDGGYLPLGVDPWGLTPGQIDTIYDVSSVDHTPQIVKHVP